jgi:hypothetical protein
VDDIGAYVNRSVGEKTDDDNSACERTRLIRVVTVEELRLDLSVAIEDLAETKATGAELVRLQNACSNLLESVHTRMRGKNATSGNRSSRRR